LENSRGLQEPEFLHKTLMTYFPQLISSTEKLVVNTVEAYLMTLGRIGCPHDFVKDRKIQMDLVELMRHCYKLESIAVTRLMVRIAMGFFFCCCCDEFVCVVICSIIFTFCLRFGQMVSTLWLKFNGNVAHGVIHALTLGLMPLDPAGARSVIDMLLVFDEFTGKSDQRNPILALELQEKLLRVCSSCIFSLLFTLSHVHNALLCLYNNLEMHCL
jgi:hypothetical protein